jgi:hypothetical protein
VLPDNVDKEKEDILLADSKNLKLLRDDLPKRVNRKMKRKSQTILLTAV